MDLRTACDMAEIDAWPRSIVQSASTDTNVRSVDSAWLECKQKSSSCVTRSIDVDGHTHWRLWSQLMSSRRLLPTTRSRNPETRVSATLPRRIDLRCTNVAYMNELWWGACAAIARHLSTATLYAWVLFHIRRCMRAQKGVYVDHDWTAY